MSGAELLALARRARENAYAPYSGFAVGAALLGADGRVYTGCNVENAAYPVACCAERTALFHAVAEGAREFTAIAVAGGRIGDNAEASCPPCGVCRQALYEFGGPGLTVIMAKSADDYIVTTLGELLPYGFGPANLESAEPESPK